MTGKSSLLDELRVEYEAARSLSQKSDDVPGYQEIDAELRRAFRWLEKAIAYLDGLKPSVAHRFDLGHGLVFESPHIARAFVGRHEQRIVGFPAIDEINISYELAALKPLSIEVTGAIAIAEKMLEDAGLQYTARHVEDVAGTVHKCVITVPPSIPAAISFRADYRTGAVRVSLVNVDRFDRVTLEFRTGTIDEPMLEDLVRLVLGRGDGFLRRAPLAGIRGKPPIR